MKNEITNVVGGLIVKDKKILICQRSKDSQHSLKWEFPGGKIKSQEDTESALKRELKEELNIEISQNQFLCDYYFDYKDLNKRVHLYFYLVSEFSQDMKNTIHEQMKWIEINELSHYDFLEGDEEVIQKILDNGIKIY